MIKIIWLSNVVLVSEKGVKTTGTWLYSMANALSQMDDVKLCNISSGNVKQCTRMDYGNVEQWVLPKSKIKRNGLPDRTTIETIQKIENEFKPDVIHIWGTEGYWGILAVHKMLSTPVVLDIQGILYAYEKVFYGGLTNVELIQSIGLKELLYPIRTLSYQKHIFKKRGELEKKIINSISNITVQSDWSEAYIKAVNPSCTIYRTGRIQRDVFYQSPKWQVKENDSPVIFTSLIGFVPYKGLHVLIRALSILKTKYPKIKLVIAGSKQTDGFFKDGFYSWLNRLAKELNVSDSIEWGGYLTGAEMIDKMLSSDAVVIPSYVETYCNALAEAMILGVPCAVSYSGAMPELAKHEESALFFPTGDHTSCAWQIDRLITDRELATLISVDAQKIAIQRNNPEKLVSNQLSIYMKIIKS